ncbi:alpha/beta hydrolase family protein [Desulfoscipio geothermicus]
MRSPIRFVNKMMAPILIVHGKKDSVVPIITLITWLRSFLV